MVGDKSLYSYAIDVFILGEALSINLANLLTSSVTSECQVWNLYGPAETTIECTFHLVDVNLDKTCVPIGRSLPKYTCMILDDFSQNVIVGHVGELLVGGVGVFAGYLARPDLTHKALVNVNEQLFYRTGDLVRLDNNGLIHYLGRKDHQVKLHGQRIELGEIERCLLDYSSHITNCVVIKWNEDHLVAYIECKEKNEEALREHCRCHLPSFMIPSMFIIVDEFPLNANGKLDRKHLPTPSLSSMSHTNDDDEYVGGRNEIEKRIHDLWCEVLHSDRVSINRSIFSMGGHSLIVIQLFHRYKVMFGFDRSGLSIAQLFQHPSIADHARLLSQLSCDENDGDSRWMPLNLTQGQLSLCFLSIAIDSAVCSQTSCQHT